LLVRVSFGASILERSQRQLVTFVGGIAIAATGGALVGIGRRLGSVSVAFAAIGGAIIQRTVTGRAVPLVIAGVILHVLVTFGWSVAFMSLVRRFGRPVVTGIGVAACSFLLSSFVTRATGRGIASVLALGDRLVLAAVLAASLVVGMRFAFSVSRDATLAESRTSADETRFNE
jgi:hypothetical protein